MEYGQIISDTVWMCHFGIRSNHFWHSLDVPLWNTVKSFLAQFGCATFEYGQIISGTVWMCHFGILSNYFWRCLDVPLWNTVKSFLAQFGCATLEYGQIISGAVWWVCQFLIRSHSLWHSKVVVPFWRHFFGHTLEDKQYYNRLDGSLRGRMEMVCSE